MDPFRSMLQAPMPMAPMFVAENREHDEFEFREMFKVIVPGNLRVKMKLNAALLDSPIGRLVVVADDIQIYLLQCLNRSKIKEKVQRLAEITHSQITAEHYKTKAMLMLEHELMQYFSGRLEVFQTPVKLIGTDFQVQVWEQLRLIPFGQQISYGKLAVAINRETSASRSVAQAVGGNKLLIMVPCHRVIQENGKLGGFNCGSDRKEMLLRIEGFRA